jgi:hypothetical protein
MVRTRATSCKLIVRRSGDSASQVIVAAEITLQTTDNRQLLPMLAQIAKNLEQKPEKASADAGYFSEANVSDDAVTGIDLYIATGRDKHGDPAETTTGDAPLVRLHGNRCDIS